MIPIEKRKKKPKSLSWKHLYIDMNKQMTIFVAQCQTRCMQFRILWQNQHLKENQQKNILRLTSLPSFIFYLFWQEIIANNVNQEGITSLWIPYSYIIKSKVLLELYIQLILIQILFVHNLLLASFSKI